jgi:hypothetical protein
VTLEHLREKQQQAGWPEFKALGTSGAQADTVDAVQGHDKESMSGTRVRQLLKHMSTTLLAYAFALDENAIEVPCMSVSRRVIIAGNSPQAMEALYVALVDTILVE